MAELEGKLRISCYFHNIFGMHLQKGLVYLYTKKFLPLLLHFWNYNLSPNGQMISLIGAPHKHGQSWMVQSIEDYSL